MYDRIIAVTPPSLIAADLIWAVIFRLPIIGKIRCLVNPDSSFNFVYS